MAGTKLSGRPLAETIRADVAARAASLRAAGHPAGLAIVSASDDESSAWYVRSLARAAEQVGVSCQIDELGPAASDLEIYRALCARSDSSEISGIILQTPLPAGASPDRLRFTIDPAKDVDGANSVSLGRLATRQWAFPPATAAAIVRLLDAHGVTLDGARVVVLGRSPVVGLPVGMLLTQRNATVTICHSHTRDLAAVSREADVLVVAIGRAGFVTPDFVTGRTIVIDVGTNVDAAGGLVGDVDPAAGAVAAGITPVPGGVGSVTTAVLLEHTVTARERLSARAR